MPLNTLPARQRTLALVTLTTLALIALWEASALDLPMAAWFADANGFFWREHWFASHVLHTQAHRLSVVFALGLLAGCIWPVGPLRRLSRRERVWLIVVTLTAMLMISVFKRLSLTSCPWDLAPFGGAHPHVPHWLLGARDGGPGHCFPAGHASSALAWVAGFFVLPLGRRVRWIWLALALAAGAVLGLAQQARGAHFMSHTLWTAWLCWTWAWAASYFLAPREMQDANRS